MTLACHFRMRRCCSLYEPLRTWSMDGTGVGTTSVVYWASLHLVDWIVTRPVALRTGP